MLARTRYLFSIILLSIFASGLCQAQVAALGDPAGQRGGTFRIRYNSEPYSLNPIVSEGFDSVEIQFYVMEALLSQNEKTYQWQPWLADRWKILPDQTTYEFHIRDNA